MSLQAFNISRLHTDCGIFKLSGTVHRSARPQQIAYQQAFFMGTDGWCALDLSNPHAVALLAKIQPQVLQHLQSGEAA